MTKFACSRPPVGAAVNRFRLRIRVKAARDHPGTSKQREGVTGTERPPGAGGATGMQVQGRWRRQVRYSEFPRVAVIASLYFAVVNMCRLSTVQRMPSQDSPQRL